MANKQVKTENPYKLINKANLDYTGQNYGKAIAKLYKASRILPRQAEIKNNLDVINSQIKLKQPNMFCFGYMTLTEALLLAIVANLVFLVSRNFLRNNFAKVLVSISFVVSLINLACIANQQIIKKYAVVTKISSQVYSGDNENYPELFELTDGQIIELKKQEKNWAQIKHGDELGWIRNEDIMKID